jgi:phage-related protein
LTLTDYIKYGILQNHEVLKRVDFIGPSRSDLKAFPGEVTHKIGHALQAAQKGQMADTAKPLKGFGGAGVLEIAESFLGNAYRAIYTVKFSKAIYVLHCFQKKSKRGIKTDKRDIRLIKQRLKRAEEDYKVTYA